MPKPIWFADLHHGSLYYSLQLLAKRLGTTIYRPIGMDWFNEGYFKLAEPYGNDEGTLKQFLSTEPHEEVPFYCNTDAKQLGTPGLYKVQDLAHETTNEAITLELFKQLQVDVLIVSYAEHLPSWIQLRDKYQPKAKIVLQVGNHGWERFYSLTNNLMASYLPQKGTVLPSNTVLYHQEFPLNVFRPSWQPPKLQVTSFVNCLPEPERYENLKVLLQNEGYEARAYGSACPDGTITGLSNIAKIMANSKWGYHIKPGGDGYGHCLFNWFATGRPIICDFSYYEGKLGSKLLIDGVTALDCHGIDTQTICNWVVKMPTTYYNNMCYNVVKRFREVVNFEVEAQALKRFFEDLQ